ncbi:MAG: DUF1697 domain-containing protein [Chloroflexi bacterium]|nr:DUF1697 domain-containing protein [Chloroflexota bacterium]
MATHISLLRGINVSGKKKIRMADLRYLYVSLGFSSVKSYLQSGNVIFESDEEDRAALANMIEAEIEKNYGYSVSLLLRSSADFTRVLQHNPYLRTRSENAKALYVTFLAEIPTSTLLETLAVPDNSDDEFYVVGKEIYLFLPSGAGRTKLTNNFFERKLKVVATTRNWRTINALFDMAMSR